MPEVFVEQPLALPGSVNYLEGLFFGDMLCFCVVYFTKKKVISFGLVFAPFCFSQFCFCCVCHLGHCMTMCLIVGCSFEADDSICP